MQALTKALLRRQALDTPQHGQEPGRGTGLTVKLNGPAEGKPLWLHAAAVCPARQATNSAYTCPLPRYNAATRVVANHPTGRARHILINASCFLLSLQDVS